MYEKKIVEEQKQNSTSKIHTLLYHDQADLYNARAHLRFYKEKRNKFSLNYMFSLFLIYMSNFKLIRDAILLILNTNMLCGLF